MAEEEDASNVNFLEVICRNSEKVRRFAAGTKAEFALSLINRKLDVGKPLASYIEAVKEGEEPVSFGPNAALVDYGNGWKLQTVTEVEAGGGIREAEAFRLRPVTARDTSVTRSSGSHLVKKKTTQSSSGSHFFGRIFLAIILIFLLGSIFTLFLENLPRIILFINSSMANTTMSTLNDGIVLTDG